eukprot:5996288-Pyramimonas_sp.AAC.1
MATWSTDVPVGLISSDEEDDLFLTLPTSLPDTHADIYSRVTTLCYGNNNCVDMLELRGGEGGISKLAFSRGLSSGGNPDKTTCVDLGDPSVQRAVDQYFAACYAR